MKNLIAEKTKCLIVQTRFSEFSYWNYKEVCEIAGAKYPSAPLGLITMASLLPKHWEFILVDENVSSLTNDHLAWADLICTGGMLPQQNEILKLIAKAKSIGTAVVVGGPDPSAQPGIYKDADFLVCGEGEVTIPLFLEDLKKGAESGFYKSDTMADMSNTVIPRYDLINFKNYINVGVQYSRGCPFTCEFCDIIEMFGRKPRLKTPVQILQELQCLYELGYRGNVDFVDDNFIGNKRDVKKLLPLLYQWSEERKFPFFFSTEASINLADDDELLTMMRKVDFRMVFVGIETPDDNLLREMGKKQNVNKPIAQMVNKILDYGIIVNAGFILGFDCETAKTADNMIELIAESGIPMAMTGLLYALPNTQLTRRLQKEGRMSESEVRPDERVGVDQFTSGLNFQTKRPRNQILRDYAKITKHIYNAENYFKRVAFVCTRLNPASQYKPDWKHSVDYFFSFLKLSRRIGFNRITGVHYWKTLLKVLVKNYRGLEMAANLSAMYIHFQKQSAYILNLTEKKIASTNIENEFASV